MGVLQCAHCKNEVNDSKHNYNECSGCGDVYCNDCPNPMKCYPSDNWQCPDCDPYMVHIQDSKFLKWAVYTYLKETTLEALTEEYIKTLPKPKKLVCGNCRTHKCEDLYENRMENNNGHISIGWCCKCVARSDEQCNVCIESKKTKIMRQIKKMRKVK
jgi:hypothetical protein